jgi:hypothetical protein
MKAGDLVKVSYLSAAAKELNSEWLHKIGIVLDASSKWSRRQKKAVACTVMWSDGTITKHFRKRKLKVINNIEWRDNG